MRSSRGTFAAAVAAWLAAGAAAGGGEAPVRWDMESLARVVRPMRHSTKGRLPLLLWNFPIPRDDQLVKLRADGTLRRHIGVLAERGIAPTVEMGWEWTLPGALAMARTLQEAGRPVHVLIPRADLLEGTAYRDCTVWAEGPDATRGGKNRKWPCLPLAKPELTAAWLRKQLQPFKDAGIRVDAVWFDDECLPHPWNGCFNAQRSTPECRRHYPPGVLDRFASFKTWAYRFRFDLFTKGAAAPVKAMFGGVLVGEYGDTVSGTGARYGLDAQMPSLYANTRHLPRAFRTRKPTQEAVDLFYFARLLRGLSSANSALVSGKLSIPYLSRYVPDNRDAKLRFPMSQGLYRELMRHMWLRGTDSLYLFNLGYPTRPQLVTPRFSFESVEDARAVYDELLAHREFLDRGEPMTFVVPADLTREGLWSGLRLKDRCLVRAVTLGKTTGKVSLVPFPHRPVTLDAPPEGATYLITRDGRAEKVAAGRM